MARRNKNSLDAARFAFPFPFVEWELVLHALDPVRDATRGWARSLRNRGQLSQGITVARRGPRGLNGRSTYNSSLWVWAERCQLAGFVEDAVALRQSARDLELRFAEPLSGFLGTHELPELPSAPFFDDLATLTADALAKRSGFMHIVLVVGQVERLNADFGLVMGHAPEGHPAVVHLPAQMLLTRGVHPGSNVWVVSRMLGDAALVEVDLATPVLLPPALEEQFEWARVSAPESHPGHDSLLADESEAAAAARYELTAALMPSLDYWDDLFKDARAGRLPVRLLHPAG